eukprot:9181324-Alexandrium_andersonii.AAC.1
MKRPRAPSLSVSVVWYVWSGLPIGVLAVTKKRGSGPPHRELIAGPHARYFHGRRAFRSC